MNTIDFWFDFGSNYSYLSMMRINQLAVDTGVEVRLKPFLLGPIFKSLGWTTSPFVLQQQKGKYVWRDMQRECDKFGLPWRQPSAFPRNAVLATRVALLMETEPWVLSFCEQVMLANFSADREIGDELVIANILAGLGVDSETVISASRSEPSKAALFERTAEAQTLGIFGAPTFFSGSEMFWGNDRLEDALSHAATWHEHARITTFLGD